MTRQKRKEREREPTGRAVKRRLESNHDSGFALGTNSDFDGLSLKRESHATNVEIDLPVKQLCLSGPPASDPPAQHGIEDKIDRTLAWVADNQKRKATAERLHSRLQSRPNPEHCNIIKPVPTFDENILKSSIALTIRLPQSQIPFDVYAKCVSPAKKLLNHRWRSFIPADCDFSALHRYEGLWRQWVSCVRDNSGPVIVVALQSKRMRDIAEILQSLDWDRKSYPVAHFQQQDGQDVCAALVPRLDLDLLPGFMQYISLGPKKAIRKGVGAFMVMWLAGEERTEGQGQQNDRVAT